MVFWNLEFGNFNFSSFNGYLKDLKSKQMRVLYISHYYLPFEGAGSIVTYELVRGLANLGHNIDLVTPQPLAYYERSTTVGKNTHGEFNNDILKNVRIFQIKTFLPYAISIWLGYLLIYYNLIKLCKRTKYDVVISQFHTYHFAPLLGYFISKMQKTPYVLKTHNILFDPTGSIFRRIYYHFAFRINSLLLHKSDLITVISPELKEEATAYFELVREKIKILPNGVSLIEFFPKDIESQKNRFGFTTQKILLFMGTLTYSDNLDILIKAMPNIIEKNPNTILLIIGDGEYKNELLDLARRTSLTNIYFLGRIIHEDVFKLIQIADLTIGKLSDSKKNYEPIGSFPMRVAEYMLCGKTTLSTKCGVTRSLIKHRYNGWLLEEVTPEKVSEAVNFLLTNDELRDRIGKNAYEYVTRNFEWKNICKLFERMLFQVIEEKRS
ncbi:MAG: glycosyltransferase family 1 protein [Dehalococcoidia bacterium]|nr:MAG: glycosyltransferase family 1 protein [Dehalococcoidia bacterium]